jgi:putative ABC transport system permease protein
MGWSRFLRRAKWDEERSREIESYLQLETDDNIDRGMSPEAAREAAQRKLGNLTSVREDIYRFNTVNAAETLGRDLRYGVRVLRRNPAFTLVALLTLAIGIGGNTAVFSIVNSVLLEPLSYPAADQLVAVRNRAPGAAGIGDVSGDLLLSPSMYFTYAEENRVFEHIGVWIAATGAVTGDAEPEQVRSVLVSDGTLQAFGVRPVQGRWLSGADQTPGGVARVMLTYGYWQRRFGGDRQVVGRRIIIDALPREIVGVMPQGFAIPGAEADVIMPLRFVRSQQVRGGFGFQGVARLKPGVTVAAASADVARMFPIWLGSWPGGNPQVYESWQITPALRPLKDDVVGTAGNILWLLMATIGIVLLIACANVANLMLVRAEGRQQEFAVRAALGAGSWRIARELVLEGVVLSLAGGAVGLGFAYAALRVLVALDPTGLPRLGELSIDPRAVGFTLAISLFSGVLLGLVPAFKSTRRRIAGRLQGAGRRAGRSREQQRVQNILVVAQVALALVLLVGSGLMLRTFQALRAVEPGFTGAEHLQTMRIAIPASVVAEPERVARMQNDIVAALAAIPGVTAVGFSNSMPMEGQLAGWNAILVEGVPDVPGEIGPLRKFRFVSPDIMRTVGTRLVAGREFTWADVYGVRPVTLVSENMARELWGSPSAALGKRIRGGRSEPWREIVGVVQDVRDNGVNAPAPTIVYWPPLTASGVPGAPLTVARNVTFAVRSERTGTESFLKQVQQAVWSVNGNLPVAAVRTLQDLYDRSLARTVFTLSMLAIGGVMALVLGIVGIYGVISYTVSQRRREIGIRMALGAHPTEVRRRFVRHGALLACIGVAIGIPAAIGLTRLMTSLLFEVSSLDPLTYAAVAILLTLAAALASYVPARRASVVSPVEALAAE